MEYKLSRYTIFSEPVDTESKRIIYSTRIGKTILVTHLCIEFLRNGMFEHIPSAILETLLKYKVLVPREENELETVTSENTAAIFSEDQQVLYEVIQPTAMCQLGCYYCGQSHAKVYIKEELIGKLVQRIAGKFKAGKYKHIHIGWFGAEPLMGLKQIRRINEELRNAIGDEQVRISGKMVTNGLSLKEQVFLELVKEMNINSFEITLDGTSEFHDRHRYTKSNEKSFELIYGNIKRILSLQEYQDLNCSITIRCNVDSANVEGVIPLIQLLAADGLHKKISGLYFASIHSWGGNDAHNKALSKEEFAMHEILWYGLQAKLGYDLDISMPQRKKQTCIAVGGKSEMYDAYGNIFNCSEVSYADVYSNSSYKLGNLSLDHNYFAEERPLNDWNEVVRDNSRQPCHHCPLLPVCGGSCPKSWVEGMPACPSYKYSIKKQLEFNYILSDTRETERSQRLEAFIEGITINDFQRV